MVASSRARSTPAPGNLVYLIYVHAKIGIVDDAWLTIGSANLNEHSLFNDTEMNVVTHDAGVARATRLRLWSEHLELPAADIPADTTRAIDELWKPISVDQLPAPGGELAPHPPAGAPAERVAAIRAGPRPAQRPARRRLSPPSGEAISRALERRRVEVLQLVGRAFGW